MLANYVRIILWRLQRDEINFHFFGNFCARWFMTDFFFPAFCFEWSDKYLCDLALRKYISIRPRVNVEKKCEQMFHTKKNSLRSNLTWWLLFNFKILLYILRTSPVCCVGCFAECEGKLIWKTAHDSSLNIIIFVISICRGEWDCERSSFAVTTSDLIVSITSTSCDKLRLSRWASSSSPSWHFETTLKMSAKNTSNSPRSIDFKRQAQMEAARKC